MLRFVICDDDPAQCSLLETYVREWAGARKEETGIAICLNGEQFLFSLEERKTDILLLDIDMPGINGISLARRLREKRERMQIIFVTGLEDYALEGYDLEAVSYLVKPVERKRLFSCLDRAKERCGREEPVLLLETPGGMARVTLREVYYLESVAHDTIVHCVHIPEPVRCKTGIRQMEERLLGRSGSFFRIHRSYLINLRYVGRIARKEVVMDTGEILPVARNRWESLNQAYLDYYRERLYS